MADIEKILNDNEFFGDTADTPKEGIEQHKKRECECHFLASELVAVHKVNNIDLAR